MLAGGLGFEPRLAESESAVLPLDDPPSSWCGAPCLVPLRAREPPYSKGLAGRKVLSEDFFSFIHRWGAALAKGILSSLGWLRLPFHVRDSPSAVRSGC